MTDCGGCACDSHTCRPDDDGTCTFYCRSCLVQLWASDTEAHADYIIGRLQEIRMVNPCLLIDLIGGAITFDEANRAASAIDPIVSEQLNKENP